MNRLQRRSTLKWKMVRKCPGYINNTNQEPDHSILQWNVWFSEFISYSKQHSRCFLQRCKLKHHSWSPRSRLWWIHVGAGHFLQVWLTGSTGLPTHYRFGTSAHIRPLNLSLQCDKTWQDGGGRNAFSRSKCTDSRVGSACWGFQRL